MKKDTFILPDSLIFFDAVTAVDGSIYFVIMEKDEFGAIKTGSNFMRKLGDKLHYIEDCDWNVTVASPFISNKYGMVACGEDGEIALIASNQIIESHLSDTYDDEFTFRRLRATEDRVIGVGYGGVVFSIDASFHWSFERFCSPNDASWVESVDIGNDGCLYLVGLNGEVWVGGDGKLKKYQVPTNANLNDVCCSSSGEVFICGSGGTFIIGHGDSWKIFEQNSDFREDFWRVVEYGGSIWVSTMTHLFEWTGHDLRVVEFGAPFGIKNYYNLRSDNDFLLVADEKRVITLCGKYPQLVAGSDSRATA